MTDQLDLFAARQARDRGIRRAVEHADAVTPKWSDIAFEFASEYARRHPTFTSEDVRDACAGSVPSPPDLRAWGGVFMRMAKAGITERAGYDTARAPGVHCSIVTVWRSLVKEAA